jgi:hypothetical protein
MDGLSVASSITALLGFAASVGEFISSMIDAPRLARDVLGEVTALSSIFCHIDDFINDPLSVEESRRSMLQIHDIVTTLTGCTGNVHHLVDSDAHGTGLPKSSSRDLPLKMREGQLATGRESPRPLFCANSRAWRGPHSPTEHIGYRDYSMP